VYNKHNIVNTSKF